MLIVVLIVDIDGNATGPVIITKLRAFSGGALVASTNQIQTQVLATDTPSQMRQKAKADVDAFIQIVTGAAPPAGSNYVVFGGI